MTVQYEPPRRESIALEPSLDGAKTLEAIVAPVVEAAGYRLVRLRLKGTQRKTLQVMAERPDGTMNVDDCAKLSRALSDVLEAADPIAEEYELEVSSPGIDRPLTRPQDFIRYAGHDARIELVSGLGGQKRFKGTLRGIEGTDVLMNVADEKDTKRFRYSDIAEAKLILTDRLIAEDLKARELREAKAS